MFFLAPTWNDGVVVSLRGEIVDSKCALGAMTPGSSKSHKICATQCIKNGIPPLLKVYNRVGNSYRYYLLVGEGKTSANQLVLPYIGIPIEVTGTIIRDANLVMLEIQSIKQVK
ncbi:MAG: hypothetical protein AAF518_24785 [Spirochaetota bacterium]